MGSTTLRPGQSTSLTAPFTMHAGMDGPHDFEIHIWSNDPQQPDTVVHVKANYVP